MSLLDKYDMACKEYDWIHQNYKTYVLDNKTQFEGSVVSIKFSEIIKLFSIVDECGGLILYICKSDSNDHFLYALFKMLDRENKYYKIVKTILRTMLNRFQVTDFDWCQNRIFPIYQLPHILLYKIIKYISIELKIPKEHQEIIDNVRHIMRKSNQPRKFPLHIGKTLFVESGKELSIQCDKLKQELMKLKNDISDIYILNINCYTIPDISKLIIEYIL
ncbi:MAG: hypothetical protein Edafosvirus10_36 [Edafosvirus sp.]|uniref:Uncharacterized protein n=1 Tax=Edafosvirus sp. TaxID=2487765 RepID=A0A3G4ZWJ6_9VIRU|nr:MAG: hypothetical protein Edafosvirus10_36 [Edafosvirus sp.]